MMIHFVFNWDKLFIKVIVAIYIYWLEYLIWQNELFINKARSELNRKSIKITQHTRKRFDTNYFNGRNFWDFSSSLVCLKSCVPAKCVYPRDFLNFPYDSNFSNSRFTAKPNFDEGRPPKLYVLCMYMFSLNYLQYENHSKYLEHLLINHVKKTCRKRVALSGPL